jgi:hypothetical protein
MRMLLAMVAAVSCTVGRGDDRHPENVEVPAPELPGFLSEFRLVDSIELEQRPDLPIVRVSGLALSPDRRLALGDASEGNVKLFDLRGRLLAVLGRSGSGPGEFQQPRFPRFDSAGRLFVGDGQLNRITEFDPRGTLARTIPLDGMTPMMGLALGPRNQFYVTGPGRGGRLVHLLDSSGKTTGGFLSLDQARPRREPDHPLWRMLSQQWLAGGGTRLYVASTLNDSLWQLDPTTGQSLTSRVQVPGYVEPRLPPSLPRGAPAITAWQESFHIVGTLLASPDLLVMPFVQGVLNYGDPMVLMVRPGEGRWLALRDAPPPVLVTGDSIFAILHPGSERVVLGVFRRRSP